MTQPKTHVLPKKQAIPILLLAIAVLLLGVFSLGIGSDHVTWMSLLTGDVWHDETQRLIMIEFRLPRIIAALLAGLALGTSGSLVQSVVRNPLASPDLLGITGGASIAWLAFLLLYPKAPLWALPLAAFTGGMSAFALVYLLTLLVRGSALHLSLIGIAVSVLASSFMRVLMIKYPMKINAGLAWLNGSLWGTDWNTLATIAAPILALIGLAWLLSRSLDVLALGDQPAQQLGLATERVRGMALIFAVALGSLAVTVAGTIGFVGLVAPHLARRITGHRHQRSLPASALIGVLLILTADMIARGLWQPIELPTGLFTAVLGAPYLLYLLYRHGGSHS